MFLRVCYLQRERKTVERKPPEVKLQFRSLRRLKPTSPSVIPSSPPSIAAKNNQEGSSPFLLRVSFFLPSNQTQTLQKPHRFYIKTIKTIHVADPVHFFLLKKNHPNALATMIDDCPASHGCFRSSSSIRSVQKLKTRFDFYLSSSTQPVKERRRSFFFMIGRRPKANSRHRRRSIFFAR